MDTRTGEIGVASATCLALQDVEDLTPVIVVGRGAACAQAALDTTGVNRALIRDMLLQGASPQSIIDALARNDGLAHPSRQYGIVDATGRTITVTGADCIGAAVGVTGAFDYTYAGQAGHIVYAMQGNILTGNQVVAAAELSLRNTVGDLPARLMSAMEAARSFGGDGRCSCNPDQPTACGSPPAGFAKAADNGFFIISRPGDSDQGSAALAAGGPGLEAVGDLAGDGAPDVVVPEALSSSSRFFVYPNTGKFPAAFASFGARAEYQCVVYPAAAACADFAGDGRAGVAIAGGLGTPGGAGGVTVYRGQAGGTLGSRADYPTARRAVGVAFADVDGVNGPDLVYVTLSQLCVRLNDGVGGFGEETAIAAVSGAGSPTIADLNGDGKPDIILGSGYAAIRVFFNLGGGAFGPQQLIPLPGTARGVVAADFDNDRDIDLAVATSTTPMLVFLNTPSGFVQSAAPNTGGLVSSLTGCDINDDRLADLAFVDSQLRISAGLGMGNGAFVPATLVNPKVPSGPLVFADLNGDGLAEGMLNSSGVLRVFGNSRGQLINQSGYTSGNYFLNINIAGHPNSDPDPVTLMRQAFDAARVSLQGVPDAIRSTASYENSLALDRSQTVAVQLRDWRGLAVTSGVRGVRVIREGTGPFPTSGETVTSLGNGVYKFTITGRRLGTDRIRIAVDHPSRTVLLSPRILVTVNQVRIQWFDRP